MKPSNVARRTRPKAAPLPGSARRLASPGKKLEAALHGRVDSGLPEPSKPKVSPRRSRQPSTSSAGPKQEAKQEARQGISRRPVAVETTRAQRGPLALEAKLAEREAAVRAELRAGREALEAELKTVK